jgi:hypothetical protein
LTLIERINVETLGIEASLAFVATHIPLKRGRFAGMTFWNTHPEIVRTVAASPSHIQALALHASLLACDETDTLGLGLATMLREKLPSVLWEWLTLIGSADRPTCVGSYEPSRMTNEYVPSSSPASTFGASELLRGG